MFLKVIKSLLVITALQSNIYIMASDCSGIVQYKNWSVNYPVCPTKTISNSDLSSLTITPSLWFETVSITSGEEKIRATVQLTEQSCTYSNKLMKGVMPKKKMFGNKSVALYESYGESTDGDGFWTSNLLAVVREPGVEKCLFVFFYNNEVSESYIGFDDEDVGSSDFISLIKSTKYIK